MTKESDRRRPTRRQHDRVVVNKEFATIVRRGINWAARD